MNAPVSMPGHKPESVRPFGPATIEHVTADCGLQQLGTYIMEFHSDDLSDPWTVQYEETIYVIEGQARLMVHEDGQVKEVVGNPGSLIVLPKGATVQYGALVGSRFLLSITPVNWRDAV